MTRLRASWEWNDHAQGRRAFPMRHPRLLHLTLPFLAIGLSIGLSACGGQSSDRRPTAAPSGRRRPRSSPSTPGAGSPSRSWTPLFPRWATSTARGGSRAGVASARRPICASRPTTRRTPRSCSAPTTSPTSALTTTAGHATLDRGGVLGPLPGRLPRHPLRRPPRPGRRAQGGRPARGGLPRPPQQLCLIERRRVSPAGSRGPTPVSPSRRAARGARWDPSPRSG